MLTRVEIIEHADPKTVARLIPFAGKECTDAGLVHDIVEANIAEPIGELVEGPAVELSKPTEEDMEKWRSEYPLIQPQVVNANR